MSANEQETDPDDDLLGAQEGKGYGDEGEREEALDDEQ
jgi:hypothetical protein